MIRVMHVTLARLSDRQLAVLVVTLVVVPGAVDH